jgi:ubiquinone/menaquinone biosynthesis C-methylase UbiE
MGAQRSVSTISGHGVHNEDLESSRMSSSRRYSSEPAEPEAFTQRFDRFYTRFTNAYDALVKVGPFWKSWLAHALPNIRGPRVLEVSCGTGYLLTKYAGEVDASAIDLNAKMVEMTSENLRKAGLTADVQQADVEALPYANESFDTVLNTMAFSGYPNSQAALTEIARVLKPGGRLVLIDVGYPDDDNRLGTLLTELWRKSGDLIRDMDALFQEAGLEYRKEPIGGFGSVHLYVAAKPSETAET